MTLVGRAFYVLALAALRVGVRGFEVLGGTFLAVLLVELRRRIVRRVRPALSRIGG